MEPFSRGRTEGDAPYQTLRYRQVPTGGTWGAWMATIDHETAVVITMKQLMWGIGVLLVGGAGVLWTILSFTVGGVREDLSGIRTEIGDLHRAALSMPDTQLALSKDITNLRVDLEGFRGDFKTVQLALNDLKSQVDSLRKVQPKKADWSFTPDDNQKIVDGLVKAGFVKGNNNIVVVPIGAKEVP
jgi:hypothetical protein